jgi:hypothetical protein
LELSVLAPEAAAAYGQLGLPLLASNLQYAMDWFGSPVPRERELRRARLDASAVSYEKNPFESSDDAIVKPICDEHGGLMAAALTYVGQQGGE